MGNTIKSMFNLQDKNLQRNNQILGSCTLSIILPTRYETPRYQSPEEIKEIIPKEISTEIIVIQYNSNFIATATNLHSKVEFESTKVFKTTSKYDQNVTDFRVNGGFVSAILKGIEFSAGRFILVMDADFPYPREIVAEIISELIKCPDSIIVASRYTKGALMQKLPFPRRLISKGARTIARHGLNISDVQDPLSGCFALPREVINNIGIEGNGNQILLEILVKVRSKNNNKNLVVTEIPFQQKFVYSVKKLEFILILDYFRAVWNLYCHSKNSKKVHTDRVAKEQLKHKSIPFLSKTPRFFTVGASGLALNYIVSFLLSNVVSNLWYIQASVFGIVLSITTNFLLNKGWTFEDKDFSIRHVSKQYLSFFVLCTFGAIVQLALVFVFVEYYHIHYASALILAVCMASLGNFLLNKKITFGEKIWE